MTPSSSIPFLALLGQTVVRAWRMFKHRRQVIDLQTWTDEQLKDIGLTRSDVRRALATPFYKDPTPVLTRTVHGAIAPSHLAANCSQPAAPSFKVIDGCKGKGQLAA